MPVPLDFVPMSEDGELVDAPRERRNQDTRYGHRL